VPIAPSSRLTGQYGTANVGTTAAASDIYSGADIQQWSARMAVDIEEQPALADEYKVRSYTLKSGSGTIRKLVASEVFFQRLAADPVVYLELYAGRAKTATSGTGARIIKGLAILSGVDFDNPIGNQVENVTFEFTGAITTGVA